MTFKNGFPIDRLLHSEYCASVDYVRKNIMQKDIDCESLCDCGAKYYNQAIEDIATYITENYIPQGEKVKNIPLHKRLGQIIKQLKKEGYSVDEIMARNGRVFTMGTEDK